MATSPLGMRNAPLKWQEEQGPFKRWLYRVGCRISLIISSATGRIETESNSSSEQQEETKRASLFLMSSGSAGAGTQVGHLLDAPLSSLSATFAFRSHSSRSFSNKRNLSEKFGTSDEIKDSD
ncbi:hypothetical protein JTE90_018787 [Oedothorax gibbosus]|uniref:Uncharacterized protein n=1 Tax=Oedothorax gibbosus TaxID=931172 RepID=A0AAV6UBN9_9ARAC|nr:hypothetical protein JTE90_018787 [Oedothorax gibbosus]